MTPFDRYEIPNGACNDLPPQVIDKYFGADGNSQRFYHLTGKVICSRCVARTACLDNAIAKPIASDTTGVQGGESFHKLKALRHEHLTQGTPVEELTDRAMEEHRAFDELATSPMLRAGQFEELPLITTRRGNESLLPERS